MTSLKQYEWRWAIKRLLPCGSCGAAGGERCIRTRKPGTVFRDTASDRYPTWMHTERGGEQYSLILNAIDLEYRGRTR